MSTDFSDALRMRVAYTPEDEEQVLDTTAYEVLTEHSKASLQTLVGALRTAIKDTSLKEYGICGTVRAYALIPLLAVSFPESARHGYVEAYPIGRHPRDTPWSPLRKRLAAHCLGMIETFLAETAPSKAYKPTHGGYPCAS